MTTKRGRGARPVLSAALGLGALLLLGDAWAVVGRPLTPISYAGVARRTTRRAVVATSAYAYTAGAVATLPAGCVRAPGAYYSCAGTYYRPYYDGPNLVYVVTPPP
ncbi:MAG: hypothetical protein IT372_12580 [Polyangiaceae bacterium]|nr:hypothetical protein [Polyangiaceae bacterium]